MNPLVQNYLLPLGAAILGFVLKHKFPNIVLPGMTPSAAPDPAAPSEPVLVPSSSGPSSLSLSLASLIDDLIERKSAEQRQKDLVEVLKSPELQSLLAAAVAKK